MISIEYAFFKMVEIYGMSAFSSCHIYDFTNDKLLYFALKPLEEMSFI
jgi:hypothetical protein